MYVGDAWRGLVGAQQNAIGIGVPVAAARHGIGGHFPQITGGNQVVERLRAGRLIERVLLDGAAHGLQVLFEDRFSGPNDGFLISAGCQANEYQNDGDYHHQFHHGESAAALAKPADLA